jgi:hypothetical protein
MKVPRETLLITADEIPDVVRNALNRLDHLRAVIETTKSKGTCTGTVYWRRDGTTPKMYANHGTNEACPIHGTPAPGKRLRVYVGTDQLRQIKVKEAMKRQEHLLDKQQQRTALERRLKNLTWKLRRILNLLERE